LKGHLFQADDGTIYSLQGAGRITESFNDGDAVIIKGEFVERSYCMQGKKTIKLLEIDYINNETADWKTYRNEEYGFEFEYPTDWFIYSDRTEAQTRIIQVASSLDRKIGEGTTFLGPVLDIRIPGKNKDKGISINMFGKSDRDIDWQSGVSMGLAISRQISILTSPDIVIYLRTSISGESINSEKLTFDQILSTFKFTEKN